MSTPAFDVAAFRAFEETGFDAVAGAYYRIFAPIVAPVVDPLLDAAHIGPYTSVLDVGAGFGAVAARATARGASAIGIDLSSAMVALATTLHPATAFQQADTEELPFPDRSFDAVVGSFILPHLARHERAIAEWVRVLVPGGYLAQAMWAPPAQNRLQGVFIDAMQAAGAAPPAHMPPGPPFFLYATDDALVGLLRGGGLTGISVTDLAFTHRVADANTLWHDLLAATVRVAALIEGQSPEMRGRIRSAFADRVAAYTVNGGLEMPVAVKVAAGRKPT